MRKMITDNNQRFIFVTNDAAYKKEVMECWIKFLFRFKFVINNKHNMLCDGNRSFACLNPQNFIISNKVVRNFHEENKLEFYYNYKLFY